MTLQTVTQIFSDLFSSEWVREELTVIWHAGEPLVLPINYYEEAFTEISRLTPDNVAVEHAFQTNGMLINDAWCEFFKKHSIMVGVSVDGPEYIHNQQRVTRAGKATYSSAISGIRCLQRNNVDFTVISVLTQASLSQARQMHDFYVAEGIKKVGFNVEEIEGSHTSSSLAGEDVTGQFEKFMRELWNLNIESQGIYYIRDFQQMFDHIIRPAEYDAIDNSVIEPFQHLNVDYSGNYSTFSPEFLGHHNDKYGNFIIGNFWTHKLTECLESEAYQRLSADVTAGTELCRSECKYFSVCGGGSPVNKLYENGNIVSTETMYCRLNVKVMARLAMEIIEASASALRKS